MFTKPISPDRVASAWSSRNWPSELRRDLYLLIGKLNIIAEIRQRRNGSSVVFDALSIPLTNFRIVQLLPGRGHGRREIHERAPNSGTTSGVQHVKVNVGVLPQRHQIANMLASGDPIAECYQNIVSLSLI